MPQLRRALQGVVQPHQQLILSQLLADIENCEEQMDALNAQIAQRLAAEQQLIDRWDRIPGVSRLYHRLLRHGLSELHGRRIQDASPLALHFARLTTPLVSQNLICFLFVLRVNDSSAPLSQVVYARPLSPSLCEGICGSFIG